MTLAAGKVAGKASGRVIAAGEEAFAARAAAKQAGFAKKLASSTASDPGEEIASDLVNPASKAPTGRSFLTAEEFAALPRTGRIDPKRIRFSQDTISEKFKDKTKGSVADLAASLKSDDTLPFEIEPIRIVVKDGMVFTLDNRRLWAFQQAGVEIPFQRLDSIPADQLFKFTTENAGETIVFKVRK